MALQKYDPNAKVWRARDGADTYTKQVLNDPKTHTHTKKNTQEQNTSKTYTRKILN